MTLLGRVVLIRSSLLLLQLLTTTLVPPYDTSALEAYSPSPDRPLDGVARLGVGNWDSIYYNHIATQGYPYEKFGAFLPGYPWLVGLLGRGLWGALGGGEETIISESCCNLLASLLLNNSLFLLNTLLLRRLAQAEGLPPDRANQAALLFALNPASIFMTVGYTESLFCCLVLCGLLLRSRNSLLSALPFALSAGVRSNGIVYAGFLVCDEGVRVWKERRLSLFRLTKTLLAAAFIVGPFYLFQQYYATLYCGDIAGTLPEWCDHGLSYSYIQRHYWSNGLFVYWEAKQLPNFLLATPILLLVAVVTGDYLRRFTHLSDLVTRETVGYGHVACLALIGLLTMNVQVLTRFLVSSCPLIFLYTTRLPKPIDMLVICYFVLYAVAGTVLHSTFYPWT